MLRGLLLAALDPCPIRARPSEQNEAGSRPTSSKAARFKAARLSDSEFQLNMANLRLLSASALYRGCHAMGRASNFALAAGGSHRPIRTSSTECCSTSNSRRQPSTTPPQTPSLPMPAEYYCTGKLWQLPRSARPPRRSRPGRTGQRKSQLHPARAGAVFESCLQVARIRHRRPTRGQSPANTGETFKLAVATKGPGVHSHAMAWEYSTSGPAVPASQGGTAPPGSPSERVSGGDSDGSGITRDASGPGGSEHQTPLRLPLKSPFLGSHSSWPAPIGPGGLALALASRRCAPTAPISGEPAFLTGRLWRPDSEQLRP